MAVRALAVCLGRTRKGYFLGSHVREAGNFGVTDVCADTGLGS